MDFVHIPVRSFLNLVNLIGPLFAQLCPEPRKITRPQL